jgi:hypothetical protein
MFQNAYFAIFRASLVRAVCSIFFASLAFYSVALCDSDTSQSVALKSHKPSRAPFYYDFDESTSRLWDDFMLVKEANSGDPTAQHTLGLYYLFGKDFSPDTVKAAYWIAKAAAQNVIPARFNLAILLNNGWGIPWDPFEAFKDFRYAAEHDMPEGEYVYGLLLTDDLTAPRNYEEAYKWIKKSFDEGYKPAKEVLDEFDKRGITAKIKKHELEQAQDSAKSSKKKGPPKTAPQLEYIDFAADSVSGVDNQTILQQALVESRAEPESVRVHLHRENIDTLVTETVLNTLNASADAGSPESLTLIGRLYDQGVGLKQDLLQASIYYLRATRFDSPWAPVLLWDLTQRPEFYPFLKTEVDAKMPAAYYVWGELAMLGFDRQITEEQALEFIEKAADADYPDALVELGDRYFSGNKIARDKNKALQLFERAEKLGSREATVRTCMLKLTSSQRTDEDTLLVKTLFASADSGSVLAEAMLGYCYEEGRGVPQSIPMALEYYRKAAQRGNRVAYNALRKMYDEHRPNDPEFKLPDVIDEEME